MSDKMKIWDNLKQPPKEALKTIKGGRLSGMTDIKPQWRYKAMTEQFGPCGIGWKYTIDRLWTEEGNDGQVLCFVNASIYYLHDGNWSEAIPGTGGSTLIAKESKGLHSSDEGFKMALTDALSVAMSRIGVAADIYMGNWTGSKYKDETSNQLVESAQELFTGAKEVTGDDALMLQIDSFTNKKDLQEWRKENEVEIDKSLNRPAIMKRYMDKLKGLG